MEAVRAPLHHLASAQKRKPTGTNSWCFMWSNPERFACSWFLLSITFIDTPGPTRHLESTSGRTQTKTEENPSVFLYPAQTALLNVIRAKEGKTTSRWETNALTPQTKTQDKTVHFISVWLPQWRGEGVTTDHRGAQHWGVCCSHLYQGLTQHTLRLFALFLLEIFCKTFVCLGWKDALKV